MAAQVNFTSLHGLNDKFDCVVHMHTGWAKLWEQ